VARRDARRHGVALSRLPRAPKRAVSDGAREHYAHPLYYDHAYRGRQADVDYYVALAKRQRGAVLEYGVGTGRIALPIAESGVDVVGIDHSAAMLRALRGKLRSRPQLRGKVEVHRGDMRRVGLDRRFGLVIAPFNTVLHLYTNDDVERFFARVRQHLLPSGRFVFDFSVPRARDLAADPERWYRAGRVRHPELGTSVRYSERFHYAPLTQILSTWMRFEGESEAQSHEILLTHRQFFPREMEQVLRSNGFCDLRWSSDFGSAKPSAATDVLVVSCRGDRDEEVSPKR